MAEDEKTKKKNELKIKKRDYTGYDDEEFDEGQAGIRKSILSKYDEELEGSKDIVSICNTQREDTDVSCCKGFRLGSSAPRKSKAIQEVQLKAAAAVNKSLLSIDYASESWFIVIPDCQLLTKMHD